MCGSCIFYSILFFCRLVYEAIVAAIIAMVAPVSLNFVKNNRRIELLRCRLRRIMCMARTKESFW